MMTESPVKSPGRRLRDLRLKRGWTQAVLAVKAKCAIGTISFAERDERYPSPLLQERLARALRVERDHIWPEDEERAS